MSDKVVVITGAGAGIGRGLAAGFCKDGATVIGFGRTEAALKETAERFGEGRMHCVVGDVAQQADVDRLFTDAIRTHGKVDVLINNAAVYPRDSFLTPSMGQLEQTLAVNVVGMARCCHKVLPHMLERGYGRILNVGSFAWKGPIPTASAYSISKAAVHSLTNSIAVEIDRARYPNVLVNELLPGVFKTGMSAEGEDPMTAYAFARPVVELPSGGPHGRVFVKGELYDEYAGGGVKSKIKKLFGM